MPFNPDDLNNALDNNENGDSGKKAQWTLAAESNFDIADQTYAEIKSSFEDFADHLNIALEGFIYNPGNWTSVFNSIKQGGEAGRLCTIYRPDNFMIACDVYFSPDDLFKFIIEAGGENRVWIFAGNSQSRIDYSPSFNSLTEIFEYWWVHPELMGLTR